MAQRLKHLPAMQKTWVQSLGQEDSLEKEMETHSSILARSEEHTSELQSLHCIIVRDLKPVMVWASLVAQTVKNLPAMQKTWVQSLSQEDPLEKEMATHSGILACEIPWTEGPGRL